MDIKTYSDSDRQAWEAFVQEHEQGWMYHLPGWKDVVEKAYGHRGVYLCAVDGGRIAGVLPMVLVKSRIFGKSLTSMPYVDSAGLLAVNAEARDALMARAVELGREHGVDYIEYRQTAGIAGNLVTDTHKVTLVMELADDHDSLFKALPPERRNRVRKAEKAGLGVQIAGREKLDVFYRIWAENMRDLGSPAHSVKFFEQILTAFHQNAAVLLVTYGGEYIGAAVALWYKDTLTLPWVSSLRKHFDLYPNNILYWEAMRCAVDRGCRKFDFGRSSVNSGTYTFKVRWGAQAKQLYWQFYRVAGKEIEVAGADNPKYAIAINVWKRIPVGLSKVIGPPIRKYITA